MSPTAALLLAQAQSYTRFGNGAKKSFANEVTNPGAWRQKNTQEDTEADEDAEYRHCELSVGPVRSVMDTSVEYP